MSSLERLPPDQRAVLALVLQRGRSYDEIANLLAIDRAAVRDRALAALDALGPVEPRVAPERRALITDYLLGQLPDRVRDDVRDRLARSPSERAWARVLAGELAPMTSKPLPEIPASDTSPAQPTPTPEPSTTPEPSATPEPAPVAGATASAATGRTPAPSASRGLPPPKAQRPSSRRGGGIFLSIALVIAVVVVIVILATSGSSPKTSSTTNAGTRTAPPPTATGTTTSTTGTTTTTPANLHIIAQINMRPAKASSGAAGTVRIVTSGKVTGVIVTANHLTPNSTHDAYAIWLATPGGASHLLGYVSPGVSKSGNLTTSGPLPANYSSYKEVLITLETTTSTKAPGRAVLQGLVPQTGG